MIFITIAKGRILQSRSVVLELT